MCFWVQYPALSQNFNYWPPSALWCHGLQTKHHSHVRSLGHTWESMTAMSFWGCCRYEDRGRETYSAGSWTFFWQVLPNPFLVIGGCGHTEVWQSNGAPCSLISMDHQAGNAWEQAEGIFYCEPQNVPEHVQYVPVYVSCYPMLFVNELCTARVLAYSWHYSQQSD